MSGSMAADRERISLHEAARRLGVHYMTAYRYVRTGRLPAERVGTNWSIDPVDLDAMRGPGRVPRGTGSVRSEGSGQLAARMVAGDEAGAWNIVEAALASSLEPADVYHELLLPALHDIGTGWAEGRLTVADEHGATVVAHRIIGRLGPRFARRGRKRGSVVLGAAPGDEHALACAVVTDLLPRGALRADRPRGQCARRVVPRRRPTRQPTRGRHDRRDGTGA